MIVSMTGYGDANIDHEGIRYALELRSVNHRYLKLHFKLPEWLQYLEIDLEKLIRKHLPRGSISYTLRAADSAGAAVNMINVGTLEGLARQLTPLMQAFGGTIDWSNLLALPGVCEPPPLDESARDALKKTIFKLTEDAVHNVVQMREHEGETLMRDLSRHCDEIRQTTREIERRAPDVLTGYQEKLKARVDQLLSESGLQIDNDDLLRELAIYADRCDINEELIRLMGHVDHFEKVSRTEKSAGRKLDFVTQEMLREINTIGSKSSDLDIARHVVQIKGLIERLKEQVQNIE